MLDISKLFWQKRYNACNSLCVPLNHSENLLSLNQASLNINLFLVQRHFIIVQKNTKIWYDQTSQPSAKVLIQKPSLKKKCKDKCSNKSKLRIRTMKTTTLKNALCEFTKNKTNLENIFLLSKSITMQQRLIFKKFWGKKKLRNFSRTFLQFFTFLQFHSHLVNESPVPPKISSMKLSSQKIRVKIRVIRCERVLVAW